jgi:cytochrome c oxidase subunit II
MPMPVRAKVFAVGTCALGGALALPALAPAANGGLTPQTPESTGAEAVRHAYWLILAMTGGIFILVTGSLLLFIIRFRSRGRPREVEGPQIRGNTRLELAWTGLPVLILAVIAAFVFYKLPSIDNPKAANAADRTDVTVKGYRFYWEFEYPNGAVGIDTLRLPVGRVVDLAITTDPREVQHSWWIPKLGEKRDAIPGRVNHMRVKIIRPGTFVGQCAEFCGVQHAAMLATLIAMPARDYDRWVAAEKQRQAAQGAGDIGSLEWQGVCAKCHGANAQGYIGPRLQGNPIINDEHALSQVIHYGRRLMPRVGPDWSDRQVKALQRYMKKHFGTQGGGLASGSQGGG